jgi:hypothetical protein
VPVVYPQNAQSMTAGEPQVCTRHIDSLFPVLQTPSGPMLDKTIGGDFATFGDVSETTPWHGMTHHSQYKCIQMVDQANYRNDQGGVATETDQPELAYISLGSLVRGTNSYNWNVNTCQLGPRSASRSASGYTFGNGTIFPVFSCSPSVPVPDAVAWVAMDFENGAQTNPYQSYLEHGDYRRGCINECIDDPPALARCQTCKPSPFGRATAVDGDPRHDQKCDACGGLYRCDGSCAGKNPANYGASCGNCGGTITCTNTCSVATPGTYGTPCGSCGGTITCGGTCSVGTPWNYGASCGCHGGGQVDCSGQCSLADSPLTGSSCDIGCSDERYDCDGSCPGAAAHFDYGQSCGYCGGIIDCSHGCSRNLAGSTYLDSYSHSFLEGLAGSSETRSFGPSQCPSGIRSSCIVNDYSGNVKFLGWASDDPTNCTCLYHVGGSALQTVSWDVTIYYQPCL